MSEIWYDTLNDELVISETLFEFGYYLSDAQYFYIGEL